MGLAQTAAQDSKLKSQTFMHASMAHLEMPNLYEFFRPCGRRISVFAPGVQPGDLVATKLNPLLPHAVPEAITAQIPAT
tara:strand:+ start:452 stop:688 length:237 start_codon:yes stop_codon:yes gene_type:complete